MPNYPCNNKTVSDEIRYENNRTYQNNVIVVSFSLFIRETTQCIFPNPPYSFHFFLNTPNLENNHSVTIVQPIIYHIIYFLVVLLRVLLIMEINLSPANVPPRHTSISSPSTQLTSPFILVCCIATWILSITSCVNLIIQDTPRCVQIQFS